MTENKSEASRLDSDSEYECSKESEDIDFEQDIEDDEEEEEEEEEETTDQKFKKRKRDRIDNEQTRKLRKRAEDKQEEGVNKEGTEVERADDVDQGGRFSIEEGEIQKQKIKDMWQLASIQDFLLLLKTLNLWSGNVVFTLDELDDALVYSNGPGLLARLHMDMILGISPKSQINLLNWAYYLNTKLKGYPEINFRPAKGQEMLVYSQLSCFDRVLCLFVLCYARAECEDFRNAIDVVIRPQSGGRKRCKTENGLDQFRRREVGLDSEGNSFYFVDLESMGAGVRMYRESGAEQWQCVGSSIDCIKQLAQNLANKTNPLDQHLSEKILENVVAALEERQENQRRQERRAKRLQLDLNNIIIGEGRQTRVRKNVDYTFNHVFDEIDQAIHHDYALLHTNEQEQSRNQKEESNSRGSTTIDEEQSNSENNSSLQDTRKTQVEEEEYSNSQDSFNSLDNEEGSEQTLKESQPDHTILQANGLVNINVVPPPDNACLSMNTP